MTKFDSHKWIRKFKTVNLTEAEGKTKPFQPGDMWSDDFDYVGMLKFGAQTVFEMGYETCSKLFSSFEDVNYHSESQDLGNALDWWEDMKGIEDEEKVKEFLETFRKKCLGTLKDMKIKWKPSTMTGRNLAMTTKGRANLKNRLANRDLTKEDYSTMKLASNIDQKWEDGRNMEDDLVDWFDASVGAGGTELGEDLIYSLQSVLKRWEKINDAYTR